MGVALEKVVAEAPFETVLPQKLQMRVSALIG